MIYWIVCMGKNKNSAIDKETIIDDTFAPAQVLKPCVALL